MEKKKIISEFWMCEPEKVRLENFLRDNLDALIAKDPSAKKGLVDLLKGTPEQEGVLPAESLVELEKTLRNDSQYAFLIRNLPVNDAVDYGNATSTSKLEQTMFSHHIGVALYEMFGLEKKAHHFTNIRINPRHPDFEKKKKEPFTGTFVHRDFPASDMMKPEKPFSIAAFSSPLNDELAPTDIFMLQEVIESMPREVRERTTAEVKFFQMRSWDPDVPDTFKMTLQEVLEHLNDPVKSAAETIAIVDPTNHDVTHPESQEVVFYEVRNDPQDIKRFTDAVAERGESVVIGKDGLLVFNEDRIFHQGNPGDSHKIALIPPEQRNTRIFLHSGGAATPQVSPG